MVNYLPHVVEKNPDGAVTETNPFDMLFKDRIIFISDYINDDVAANVIIQLLALDAKDSKSDITLYMSSLGGDFNAVTSILDTIKYIRPKIISVIFKVGGTSALIALQADKRLMLKNSEIRFSEPSIARSSGKATEIKNYVEYLTSVRKKYENYIFNSSNLSEKKIHELVHADKIFTAEESLNNGMVDEILTNK